MRTRSSVLCCEASISIAARIYALDQRETSSKDGTAVGVHVRSSVLLKSTITSLRPTSVTFVIYELPTRRLEWESE